MSVHCASRTGTRHQLMELGAESKANKRKRLVMQRAVNLPRKFFPKDTGIARSLQALLGCLEGSMPQQVQEIL